MWQGAKGPTCHAGQCHIGVTWCPTCPFHITDPWERLPKPSQALIQCRFAPMVMMEWSWIHGSTVMDLQWSWIHCVYQFHRLVRVLQSDFIMYRIRVVSLQINCGAQAIAYLCLWLGLWIGCGRWQVVTALSILCILPRQVQLLNPRAQGRPCLVIPPGCQAGCASK